MKEIIMKKSWISKQIPKNDFYQNRLNDLSWKMRFISSKFKLKERLLEENHDSMFKIIDES